MSGLNKEIEKVREKLKELDEKISEGEAKGDDMSLAAVRVYKSFRAHYLQKKADLVSKLGRGK